MKLSHDNNPCTLDFSFHEPHIVASCLICMLCELGCIMHLVDPPTRSFAFPTPIHFHLLRPLEPHPHPLPPSTKKIKIMTLLNP